MDKYTVLKDSYISELSWHIGRWEATLENIEDGRAFPATGLPGMFLDPHWLASWIGDWIVAARFVLRIKQNSQCND